VQLLLLLSLLLCGGYDEMYTMGLAHNVADADVDDADAVGNRHNEQRSKVGKLG